MSDLLIENSCVRPWLDKFRSSFLCKISAEQSRVRRQTGSCMESTVRESWLLREAYTLSVSSNKRTRASPWQSYVSLPWVNKRLWVLLLSSQSSTKITEFVGCSSRFANFAASYSTEFGPSGLRFEARACLLLPQCFEEVFDTITFIRVIRPA